MNETLTLLQAASAYDALNVREGSSVTILKGRIQITRDLRRTNENSGVTTMKMIIATTLAIGLAAAPLVHASGTIDDARRAVQIGTDYGISHFHSIELEDDHHDDDSMEIEGWVDGQWYVELDVSSDGSIRKEERRKRKDGPQGMSSADTLGYIEASVNHGMSRIEEIQIKGNGKIEVEGNNADGRELEIDFRTGSMKPVKVD
ncbi:PepSY domain-containing protein [Marinobacter sp. F3R11]|uniref:PepSY domain-containing protein n=1 Tax=Marinobacter sp. F3R11 TaxID=2267231 RepID=UPI000DEA0BAF|nr:PepSY domain-containing protein [Marinobacter sp. F3R11]RBW48667.1 hypothetical protein DS878_10900 [Marinobacter sp. F3R11]